LIFRKKKYHFNPVTLTFEEIKSDRKTRAGEFIIYIVVSMMVTLLVGFILNQVFGSPESKILENKLFSLNHQMQQLLDKGHHFSSILHKDHFPKDNTYRAILQIDTISDNIREAGTGGYVPHNPIFFKNDVSDTLGRLITTLNSQLQIQTGSYETVYKKALEHQKSLSHMPAIQPISQKDLIMISSNFGVRSDPFLYHQEVHYGLDFVAATGKDVYATGDGSVTLVKESRIGYGNEIFIDHGFGFGSRYAHLSQILVKEGQKIKRGQLIGKVGESGRATGPHLHYEVLYENKPVNPSFYFDNSLTVEEYQRIVKLASNKTRTDVK
jgi:murein DD-endopeptidase MepM/ murein hydrolase activator NlpD